MSTAVPSRLGTDQPVPEGECEGRSPTSQDHPSQTSLHVSVFQEDLHTTDEDTDSTPAVATPSENSIDWMWSRVPRDGEDESDSGSKEDKMDIDVPSAAEKPELDDDLTLDPALLLSDSPSEQECQDSLALDEPDQMDIDAESDTQSDDHGVFDEVHEPSLSLEELQIVSLFEVHNALDDLHFRQETFLDLEDPDLIPGESGVIKWDVHGFHGTDDAPNKARVMYSDYVSIGGYSWRIKLLPRGDGETSPVAAFVELSTPFAGSGYWDEDELPLPAKPGRSVVKEPSIVAQIGIVMFNSDEPRVFEFASSVHQFSEQSPDHGWRQLSSIPWYQLHRRQHERRAALVSEDKLSFKAYIRIIHDLTGCKWDHVEPSDQESIQTRSFSSTGLIPLPESDIATLCFGLLLHYKPFRDALVAANDGSDNSDLLNYPLSLLKCMRWRSHVRDVAGTRQSFLDVAGVQSWQSHDFALMMDIIHGALCDTIDIDYLSPSRRILVEPKQELMLAELLYEMPPSSMLSQMVVVEIRRQRYDAQTRRWQKVCTDVVLDDRVMIGSCSYVLYGFVTHRGDLEGTAGAGSGAGPGAGPGAGTGISTGAGRGGTYAAYFRPLAEEGMWYSYSPNKVERLSKFEAGRRARGKTVDNEVAYLAFYVRNDYAMFNLCSHPSEPWDVKLPPRSAWSRSPSPKVEEEKTNDDLPPTKWLLGKRKSAPEDETVYHISSGYLSKASYTGTVLSDGSLHGEGVLISQSGSHYRGSFCRNLRHGQGHLISPNGDTYTGSFANDKCSGFGVFLEASTGNKYEGNWLNGRQSGEGVTTWKKRTHDDMDQGLCRICYTNGQDAAFLECGHVVACVECAGQCLQCPICRADVQRVLRIFMGSG